MNPIFKKVGRQRIGLNPAVPSTTLFQWMADLAFRLVQLALDKEGWGRIVCGALLMSLGKWANWSAIQGNSLQQIGGTRGTAPHYRTPLVLLNAKCNTRPPFKCMMPKIRAHLCITWTWFLPAFLLFLLQVRKRPTAGAARGNSIPTVLTRGFHFCFLFHHSTFSTTCYYITYDAANRMSDLI